MFFLIIWLPGASREEGALRFSTMAEEGEEGASLGVIAFIIYQHDLRHPINLETPHLVCYRTPAGKMQPWWPSQYERDRRVSWNQAGRSRCLGTSRKSRTSEVWASESPGGLFTVYNFLGILDSKSLEFKDTLGDREPERVGEANVSNSGLMYFTRFLKKSPEAIKGHAVLS